MCIGCTLKPGQNPSELTYVMNGNTRVGAKGGYVTNGSSNVYSSRSSYSNNNSVYGGGNKY